MMVQLCSENLELFYSNKRNATKTYGMPRMRLEKKTMNYYYTNVNKIDFGLEIVEALSQLCEEFIAITTIFVHRSNVSFITSHYSFYPVLSLIKERFMYF